MYKFLWPPIGIEINVILIYNIYRCSASTKLTGDHQVPASGQVDSRRLERVPGIKISRFTYFLSVALSLPSFSHSRLSFLSYYRSLILCLSPIFSCSHIFSLLSLSLWFSVSFSLSLFHFLSLFPFPLSLSLFLSFSASILSLSFFLALSLFYSLIIIHRSFKYTTGKQQEHTLMRIWIRIRKYGCESWALELNFKST